MSFSLTNRDCFLLKPFFLPLFNYVFWQLTILPSLEYSYSEIVQKKGNAFQSLSVCKKNARASLFDLVSHVQTSRITSVISHDFFSSRCNRLLFEIRIREEKRGGKDCTRMTFINFLFSRLINLSFLFFKRERTDRASLKGENWYSFPRRGGTISAYF